MLTVITYRTSFCQGPSVPVQPSWSHAPVILKGFKESDKWQGRVEALPLSPEVQSGPPCFLNSFSEGGA